MPIVSQVAPFSYSSYILPFPLLSAPIPRPMLPAPKIAGLLPARVPPAPAYSVHWTVTDYEEALPHKFPTPEEIDQDIQDTFRHMYERLMAARR